MSLPRCDRFRCSCNPRSCLCPFNSSLMELLLFQCSVLVLARYLLPAVQTSVTVASVVALSCFRHSVQGSTAAVDELPNHAELHWVISLRFMLYHYRVPTPPVAATYAHLCPERLLSFLATQLLVTALFHETAWPALEQSCCRICSTFFIKHQQMQLLQTPVLADSVAR